MTDEKIFEELKEDFEEWSMTLVNDNKSAVEETQERVKLAIWVFGLTLGLGLFLYNFVDRDKLGWCFSNPILLLISIVSLYNLVLGVLLRMKLSRRITHQLAMVDAYNRQRSLVKMLRLVEQNLSKLLIDDYKKNKDIFFNNITNTVYKSHENLVHNAEVNESDREFLNSTRDNQYSLLILQFALIVIFVMFQLFN
ncbi:MAG: hypothetical protein HRT71_13140 [Flavobacteriales bacterium]|nr:hypothetical protein [Flavobacteriales bacterium]